MSESRWKSDTQFQDVKITEVVRETKGWAIQRDDGWNFYVPENSPIAPAVGMSARFFGKGIGYTVRGLVINGQEVFYRSEQEQCDNDRRDAERREQEQKYDFEKNRADMDRRYRALPEVFQRRLDKFRTNNPDFRWQFESYEMFCCEQAVVIATGLKTPDAISGWYRKPFEEQRAIVPALSDGHSGNTMGCAVALAIQYVNMPENVVRLHGAMAVIVGSEEYGCVPRPKRKRPGT